MLIAVDLWIYGYEPQKDEYVKEEKMVWSKK